MNDIHTTFRMSELSPACREALFAKMRELGDEAARYDEQYKQLTPRHGEVSVGGAHFDAFLKAIIRCVFLASLRKDRTTAECETVTKQYGVECVQKWNASREHQVHRWVHCADMEIEHIREVFENYILAWRLENE